MLRMGVGLKQRHSMINSMEVLVKGSMSFKAHQKPKPPDAWAVAPTPGRHITKRCVVYKTSYKGL